jgi:hypothetical protein
VLYSNLNLAITLRQSGHLKQAQEICQQQMQLANRNAMGQTAIAGWISAILGEVQAELNDLDGATHQAKRGVELTEHAGDVALGHRKAASEWADERVGWMPIELLYIRAKQSISRWPAF